MKPLLAAVCVMLSAVLTPVQGQACRVPPRPAALLKLEADAIVLALITDVEESGASWRATAISQGTLIGSVRQRVFRYGTDIAETAIVVTCDQPRVPKRDRYWVLYLTRTGDGLRVNRGYPYWWAKASNDPRLDRLDDLLPLGPVREPTADEARLLELAEPRVLAQTGASDLSGYTRIYARPSPSWVRGKVFWSGTSRRLMVDNSSELPTEESCRCKLIDVFVQLDDLWRAGGLPPFAP